MSMGLSVARDEWLAARRKGIGASDAPTVVGVRTTPSRLRLWLDKRGDLEPDEPSEAMRMGLAAEPAILQMYEDRTGTSIVATQVHEHGQDIPWMLATIDAYDSGDNIVECKLAGAWTTRRLPEEGDSANLPEPWIIQAQHQMAVTNLDHVIFAVWCADPSFRLYTVERNDDVITEMIRLEEAFWKQVQDGTPPAEFGAEDIRAITRHFNRDDGPAVELGDDLRESIGYFENCGGHIKTLERAKDEAKAKLLLAMGNASTATCGPYTLKRKIVQVKERTQFAKASTYVRFTVSNGEAEGE